MTTNEMKQVYNLGIRIDHYTDDKGNDQCLYVVANKKGENVLWGSNQDMVFLTSVLAYNYIKDRINDGHSHFFEYSGEIPNTGIKRCSNCYLREDVSA